MKFRDHLPDDCPPEDAQNTDGLIYRLIERDTPTAEDFKSYREKRPKQRYSLPECQVCGLSVFPDITSPQKLIDTIPALFESKIASAVLDGSHGKIKSTPSKNSDTHHTWWVPEYLDPSPLFVVEKRSEGT